MLGRHANQPWPSTLAWGIAVPYLVWNWNMGLTVFLHHTHFAVRWFRSERDVERCPQQELTIHVRYPRWYGWLSHEIMEHPAHHLDPLIPFYRLHAAQTRLIEVRGDQAIGERVSVRYVASLLRRCKLYDYERGEWTDFSGRVTGQDRTPLGIARHAP